jgi:hypothetical protein
MRSPLLYSSTQLYILGVFLAEKRERRTLSYTCHYGCHCVLRDNGAEIFGKELRKGFLSTSRSIIEFNAECRNPWMLQVPFLPLDL